MASRQLSRRPIDNLHRVRLRAKNVREKFRYSGGLAAVRENHENDRQFRRPDLQYCTTYEDFSIFHRRSKGRAAIGA